MVNGRGGLDKLHQKSKGMERKERNKRGNRKEKGERCCSGDTKSFKIHQSNLSKQ